MFPCRHTHTSHTFHFLRRLQLAAAAAGPSPASLHFVSISTCSSGGLCIRLARGSVDDDENEPFIAGAECPSPSEVADWTVMGTGELLRDMRGRRPNFLPVTSRRNRCSNNVTVSSFPAGISPRSTILRPGTSYPTPTIRDTGKKKRNMEGEQRADSGHVCAAADEGQARAAALRGETRIKVFRRAAAAKSFLWDRELRCREKSASSFRNPYPGSLHTHAAKSYFNTRSFLFWYSLNDREEVSPTTHTHRAEKEEEENSDLSCSARFIAALRASANNGRASCFSGVSCDFLQTPRLLR